MARISQNSNTKIKKRPTLVRAKKVVKTIEISLQQAAEKKAEVDAIVNGPCPKALKTFQKIQKQYRQDLQKRNAKSSPKNFIAKEPKRGKFFTIDLRIQSPGTEGYFGACGVDIEPALIKLAEVKGIDIISLTDIHNVSYVDAIRNAAHNTKVKIIPGFICSCSIDKNQEVSLIALFPEETSTADLNQVISELGIYPGIKTTRPVLIEKDLNTIIEIVEARHGILIPSRLDKTPYGQKAIIRLVDEFGFHTFDLVHPENTDFFKAHWPNGEFTFCSFSNAQSLAQVGSRSTKLKLSEASFNGLVERIARRK